MESIIVISRFGANRADRTKISKTIRDLGRRLLVRISSSRYCFLLNSIAICNGLRISVSICAVVPAATSVFALLYHQPHAASNYSLALIVTSWFITLVRSAFNSDVIECASAFSVVKCPLLITSSSSVVPGATLLLVMVACSLKISDWWFEVSEWWVNSVAWASCCTVSCVIYGI